MERFIAASIYILAGYKMSERHANSNEESKSFLQEKEKADESPPSTRNELSTTSSNIAVPTTQTIKDEESGRFIFSHNGQKIYSWEQTLDEVNLFIPAPPNHKASAFEINIHPQKLQVGLKGHDRYFIDEATFSKVDKFESSWYLDEDEGEINIVLIKAHRGEVWATLTDSSSKLDPLAQDRERQKLMLEKFQEEHRGFDFRNAEFSGSAPDPRTFMDGVQYR